MYEASEFLLLAGACLSTKVTYKGCVENFFEMVVPSYSQDSFRSHFRMTRNTMQVGLYIGL
jgi:hypothetical protein